VAFKLKCADLGMNCNWEGTANSMDELTKMAGKHAMETHKMTSMPPEMMAKVQAAVKKM